MPHVVLLGDSIFDNAAYVGGGPDVVRQLRAALPEGWSATLAAVDGSVTSDVPRQLTRVPESATHLVLSVGGNDALGYVNILERRAHSVAEVLDLLAEMGGRFAERYRAELSRLLDTGLPLTVCTIYEGAFPDASMQRRAGVALHVFNDAIVRAAIDLRLGLIDLRLVCRERGDYANPIEPSVQGGDKIARAIVRALTESRSIGQHAEAFA